MSYYSLTVICISTIAAVAITVYRGRKPTEGSKAWLKRQAGFFKLTGTNKENDEPAKVIIIFISLIFKKK